MISSKARHRAQFFLSNMSCRTLRQSGKCPPLDDHIDHRWERSRPMEYSHTLLEESSIFYNDVCNIYILRFDIFD